MSLETLTPLFTGLIGVLLGGCFTLLGVNKQFKNQLHLEKEKEQALINGFLKGLKAEIDVLWARYNETVGKIMESIKEDGYFDRLYPVSLEFFKVYDNNTNVLGLLKDDQDNLRQNIILFYTHAKGLLVSLDMNNTFVKELRNYH